MGTTQFDVGLGNSTHADLIKCTREEGSKRAHEWNGTLAAATANSNSNQVLLSNEALDEALWEFLLKGDGKGAILGVTVHGYDTVTALAKLLDGCAICNTSSYLHIQKPGHTIPQYKGKCVK